MREKADSMRVYCACVWGVVDLFGVKHSRQPLSLPGLDVRHGQLITRLGAVHIARVTRKKPCVEPPHLYLSPANNRHNPSTDTSELSP